MSDINGLVCSDSLVLMNCCGCTAAGNNTWFTLNANHWSEMIQDWIRQTTQYTAKCKPFLAVIYQCSKGTMEKWSLCYHQRQDFGCCPTILSRHWSDKRLNYVPTEPLSLILVSMVISPQGYTSVDHRSKAKTPIFLLRTYSSHSPGACYTVITRYHIWDAEKFKCHITDSPFFLFLF